MISKEGLVGLEEEIASTLEKFKGLEKLEILPRRVSSTKPIIHENKHEEGLVVV